MWADQPATRAQVNMLVKSSAGTSAMSSTTADQNSTFVARTRSGLRALSSASAAEPGQANSRGETVAGSLAYALAEGLLVAVAVVLTVYAASGRFAGWPWLLGVPLVLRGDPR